MTSTPDQAPSPDTIDALARIVGEEHAIRDEEAMTPYLVEWRDRYRGKAALVLKPGSTEEVSAILQRDHSSVAAPNLCRRHCDSTVQILIGCEVSAGRTWPISTCRPHFDMRMLF